MRIAERAFFLNHILTHMEEYLLKMSYPDIIQMFNKVNKNTYSESHFIHARALYNFFYTKPRKNDICSKDYNYSPTGKSEICESAINHISRGLAHITKVSQGPNRSWGREVGIKLEALLVPEIQCFLHHIQDDTELKALLEQFAEFNYESRIMTILYRCDAYPIINISS